PAHGTRARGLRTPEDRFAVALSDAINAMAADGWDYLRAETLPCEERTGWLSSRTTTTHHTVLVFRRALGPRADATPVATPDTPVAAPAPVATGMEGLRAIPSRAASPQRAPAMATPAQRREPTVPIASQDSATQPPRGPLPPRPVRRND
ncbi:DUF4177 domain-containing protein, partial [Rhodobaculum claviforme]